MALGGFAFQQAVESMLGNARQADRSALREYPFDPWAHTAMGYVQTYFRIGYSIEGQRLVVYAVKAGHRKGSGKLLTS